MHCSLSKLALLDANSIEASVVSFDLFDTLLRRKYLNVNEVHDTVSAFVLARLGKLSCRSPGELTITRYVVSDVFKTAPRGALEEPGLRAVWTRVVASLKDQGDDTGSGIVDDAVALEFDIELLNLDLMPGALQVLQSLAEAGKRLVAISDMYFDQQQITRILTNLGIAQFFEKIYVSSDIGATKQTGRLFRRVLSDLGVEPADMHHVGDNPHSDIVMAMRVGLAATHVAQHAPLERPPYGHRPLVVTELADIVKLYLFRMLLRATDNRTEHIFFLSRDGILLRRALEQWRSPLVTRYLDTFEKSDLFVSRGVSSWLAVDFSRDWLGQAIGLAFWLLKGRATGRQLSSLLGIDTVPRSLGTDVWVGDTHGQWVTDEYREAGLSDNIREVLVQRRQVARSYFSGTAVYSSRHVTFCDVGYSGTLARDLNKFFIQESLNPERPQPARICLELVATNGNYWTNAVQSRPTFDFPGNAILDESKLPDILKDSFAWLELFFKHPTFGPLKGYGDRDGRIGPDYEVLGDTPRDHPTEQLLGAFTFEASDIALLWMAAAEFWGEVTGPIVHRFAHPDIDTVRQMTAAIYEDDAVSGRLRSVLLVEPGLSDHTIRARARSEDYWIPGSIVASRHAEALRTDQTGGAEPASPRRIETTVSVMRDLQKLVRGSVRLGRVLTGRQPLDLGFYRVMYPDLTGYDDRFLRVHYARHGAEEGRHPTAAALIADLERRHGPLPVDFEPQTYRDRHDDLHFEHDWQLAAHYLLSGRGEGRDYHAGHGLHDADFDALADAGTIRLSAAEQAARACGRPVRLLLFRRAGVRPGPWLDLLHVGEFEALNRSWSGPLSSRAHAIAAFLDEGLERLAPLSLNASFDPCFYVRRNRELAKAAPADAYRHWLQHGAGRGVAGSSPDLLFQLVGEKTYPRAFRADRFAAWRKATTSDLPDDPVDLLQAFLSGRYASHGHFVLGPGAAQLWAVAGSRARDRGDLAEARLAFENALAAGGPEGQLLHQIADMAKRSGDLEEAVEIYGRAVLTDSPDRWSSVNAAVIAADLGRLDEAVEFLRRGQNIWSEKEPWRRARHHVLQALSEVASRQALDDPSAAPSTLDTLARLVREGVGATSSLCDPEGHVVVLSDHAAGDDGARVAASLGLHVSHRVRIFPQDCIDAFTEQLAGARVAVFRAIRSDPRSLHALFTARAVGVPTIYWAGRLDGRAEPSFRDDTASRELALLLACPVARHFMALCDEGAATTPVAAVLLGRTTAGRRATLVGRFASSERPAQPTGGALTLAIAVPTSPDARRQAWSAVDRMLAKRGSVRIITDPAGDPPRAVRRHGDRVQLMRLRATDATSLLLLEQVDGIVGVEPDGPETGAEPQIGSVEAAHLGLPFFALRPARARRDQRRRSSNDTLDGLLDFVDETIAGAQAGAKARADFAASHLAGFAALAPKRTGLGSPRRPRLMVANVFFPPQLIGGATRVVRDNVDYMLDHHADEFEMAALTSDDDNARDGVARIDGYRGMPVMRIATPQQIDMDWRPYNARNFAHAETALQAFKPDLVHIHCLQRLGVGVAEACRAAGIPYIVTLHDAWWLSDFAFLVDDDGRLALPSRDPAAQPISRRIGMQESLARASLLRAALAGAHKRLAVSKSFADIYEACGFRCDVVANGVPRLKTVPREPAEAKVRLAHAGGTQHHKGAYLIETVLQQNEFRNLSFRMLDMFRNEGDATRTVWGNTPVEIAGKMGAGQIASLYAQTDVLLAPSIWPESFGLVAREALHAGCWVVASDLGAMGEDVVDGENGFIVRAGDADDLLRVLRGIDDDAERFKTSPPPVRSIRTNDDQSRDLLELYRQIFGDG